ncbi:MAG: hypothetical protein ACT4OY_07875 [Alphaproteobacteria bacterium]
MATSNANTTLVVIVVAALAFAGGYYYYNQKDKETVLDVNIGGENLSVTTDKQ